MRKERVKQVMQLKIYMQKLKRNIRLMEVTPAQP